MTPGEFIEKLRQMDDATFAVALDRAILVVEEAKLRGVLGPASNDLFQRQIEAARQQGFREGMKAAAGGEQGDSHAG